MTERRGSPVRVRRSTQYLPVPLAGTTPVRIAPRRRRRLSHRLMGLLTILSGVGAGVAGVAMLVAPDTDAAGLSGHRVTIGGMSLVEVGGLPGASVLYGGDASYVLSTGAGGSAVAAAAWGAPGAISTGVCHLTVRGRTRIDECTFWVRGEVLTSVDALDPVSGTAWQRTYGDGVRVTIDVLPGATVIPVPFPMDH